MPSAFHVTSKDLHILSRCFGFKKIGINQNRPKGHGFPENKIFLLARKEASKNERTLARYLFSSLTSGKLQYYR